jgi:transposase
VEKETLRMSAKERMRLAVMYQVQEGSLLLVEAQERLGLSYRQTKRVWARFKAEGASGLVHGSRGRVSNRRRDAAEKRRVLEICGSRYEDFGPTLASEKLAEEHGIRIPRETLRRWMHGAHLRVPRRPQRQHRQRRERRACFGELVQADGSPHAWFEDRGEPCSLMVMVDDATGITLARFFEAETTYNALSHLRDWVLAYGIPQALYTDRHSIYRAERDPTREEKREGVPALTDFGRSCLRLNIEHIHANSPQAKGRVERKNGVFQDRLVKEMRLRGISTIEEGNAFLAEYLPGFNERFAKPPANPVNRHRQAPAREVLEDLLGWEVRRSLARDYTVTWGSQAFQIERQGDLPCPGSRLTLRRRLDGRVWVLWGERRLASHRLRSASDNYPVGSPLPPRGLGGFSKPGRLPLREGSRFTPEEGG